MLELIVWLIGTIIAVGALIYATDYLTFLTPNARNAVKFLWVVLGVLFMLYKAGVV